MVGSAEWQLFCAIEFAAARVSIALLASLMWVLFTDPDPMVREA
jgi:hypothetical protein